MVTLYLPDIVGLLGLALNTFIVGHFVRDKAELWHIYTMMGGTVVVLYAFRRVQHFLGENHRLHRTFDWWVMLAGLSIYLNIHSIVDAVGRPLFDDWLITRDQAIFGGQASVVLSAHVVPWLTDICFFFYTSYYAWIALTGIILARYDTRAFRSYLAAIGITFFAMMWGYMAIPAIGPRYTEVMAQPLVGHWFGNYMRDAFNSVVFIKDCFPSGHTLQTVVAAYYAWRYLPRPFAVVMQIAAMFIVFSTIYCRMHYAFDLLAALPIALTATLVAERYSHRLLGWAVGDHLLTNLRPY